LVLDEIAGQFVEDGDAAGRFASLGLRASVQWWAMPYWAARKGSQRGGVEVVEEGGGEVRGWPSPEGGFDDGADARGVACLVVVGGP